MGGIRSRCLFLGISSDCEYRPMTSLILRLALLAMLNCFKIHLNNVHFSPVTHGDTRIMDTDFHCFLEYRRVNDNDIHRTRIAVRDRAKIQVRLIHTSKD